MNTNDIKSLSAPNEIFIKTKTEEEEFVNFNSKIKNSKIREHQSRRLKSRQNYTKQHLFNSNNYVASTSNNNVNLKIKKK
uniref:Uncharacterized protein n=1 Tax=Meloidogyne floridensis TaxID=298350 RepID=A0A915NI01_9BILA